MTENLEFLPGRQHRDPIPGFEGLHARERFEHSAGDFVVDYVHPSDVPHMPEPVKVEQVAGHDYEAMTVAITAGSLVPVLGFDPNRKRAFIVNNTSGQPVLIGKRTQIASGVGGYTLTGLTTSPELTTRKEIYAILPTGASTTVTLSVWVERE